MCHWRNSFRGSALGAVFSSCLLCGLIFSALSCGFADLRPVGVRIFPEKMNTILDGEYSPLSVGFDTAMEKAGAEGILQVMYGGGTVEGDLSWTGNSLYFRPVSGWRPGTRYTLTLSGTLYSLDGRELRLDTQIPFYALSRSPAPLLESWYPPEGASVGTAPEDHNRMEFFFSLPMDRMSTEAALVLEGMGKKKYEWQDDDRRLLILPESSFSPWKVYRWSIGTEAKSRQGVSLARAAAARFSTDLDRLFPAVLRVRPLINSGGRWLPTGETVEKGLGPGQGIGVDFNKPVGENVLRAIRLEPSLPGRTERLSPSGVVFIPDRDPAPETFYTLIVSGDVRDEGGLSMGADYALGFIADIPFLRVLSVTVEKAGSPIITPSEAGNAAAPGENGGVLRAPVDEANGGVLRFTIRFSLPFDTAAKLDAGFRVSLETFFPKSLKPVSLRYVNWLSDDLMRMEWEGLIPGIPGEAHYYRLLVPGGRGGIGSGGGMYLEENQFLFLEAE
ncbi:MAG: Ig-like domain-containing protein [Treponema sp.]|jgi:hypothetical protein|nr:Ig-like domain-containing protein [Treponema sp.]